jgi:hypothetical protein
MDILAIAAILLARHPILKNCQKAIALATAEFITQMASAAEVISGRFFEDFESLANSVFQVNEQDPCYVRNPKL